MSQQKHPFLLLSTILLLAFGLRLAGLDARALWFDEGVSLTYAGMSIPDLLHYNVLWEEVNPPAYRVLLGVWMRLVGGRAFTARYFSLLLGVLGVGLTYRLGRRLHLPSTISVIAAGMVALAPMQIYYGREAKGYSFVQLFVLLVLLLWLRLFTASTSEAITIRRTFWPASLYWIALTLATALAVGSHYMSGLLFIVLNLWALIRVAAARGRGQPWRELWPVGLLWFSTQVVAVLAWLPWVLATAGGAAAGTRTAAANGGFTPSNPLAFTGGLFAEFAGGPVGPAWMRITLAALLSLAVLSGVWLLRRRTAGWMLTSWVVGSMLLGMLVQVAVPFFFPRFLMYLLPALALLAAAALNALPGWQWKTLPAAGASLLAVGLVTAQHRLPNPLPDLRPLAADLSARFEPGDALVYSYSWQPGMMDAYLPQGQQPVMIPSFFDDLDQSLGQAVSAHGRVWLLTYEIGGEDPINDVGLWLLAHGATPGSTWYNASQLTLFLAPDQVDNPGPAETCAAFDGGRIDLCYALLEAEITDPVHHPLTIALDWEAQQNLPERYIVFVHVLEEGQPVPIAQQDRQPVNDLRPTYTWQPGEQIATYHAIWLPPGAAGSVTYRVVVGLYDADTLERVPVDGGGDSVEIGVVQVNRWASLP